MALSLYSLVSSPPDKDRVFGNDVFVWINSLALWALPLYSLTGTQGERLRCIPFSPLLRFYKLHREKGVKVSF